MIIRTAHLDFDDNSAQAQSCTSPFWVLESLFFKVSLLCLFFIPLFSLVNEIPRRSQQ